MAKKKDTDPAALAMAALVAALDASNATYAPGIETARIDSAELILKLATEAEKEEATRAFDFLVRATEGKVPSLGASLRARAAGIVLRYARGTL